MGEPVKAEARILVVDDDPAIRRFAELALGGEDFEVTAAETAEDALGLMARGGYDLILTDLNMPGQSGLDLLALLQKTAADVPVLIMTAFGSVESAVNAMRLGALDYVAKPLDGEDLCHRIRAALRLTSLEAENRELKEELSVSPRPGRIVAVSEKMRTVVAEAEKLAAASLSVLIVGETGTGKELVARSLHHGGPRAEGPFVAVNCAALPADLIESELFGSAKGAFTGAFKDRVGKMEAAHRGTLLLDEIGELPLALQPKLLRALEERAVERVGENRLRQVDVRVVAATNRDPLQLVKEGRFREDLYFRLAGARITIPPLRARPEDVVPLARFLMRRVAGESAPELAPDALEALQRHPWPGNARELTNVIERALAFHPGGPLTARSLFAEEAAESKAGENGHGRHLVPLPEGGAPLDDMVRDLILQALERTDWNQSAAARLLRIRRHILQYRMAKFGLTIPRAGNSAAR
jgi:DNA-binding NtrC family response regulator